MAAELEGVRQEHRRRKETGVSEWDELFAAVTEWLGPDGLADIR
jgi:hypothetical protein